MWANHRGEFFPLNGDELVKKRDKIIALNTLQMRKLKINAPVLKKLGIIIIYRFGSSVEGTANAMSDLDFGIVVKNETLLEDTRFLYERIYTELARFFKPGFKRDLDLVFLQKSSIPLQFNILRYGKVIYDENPVLTADYEQRVMNQYLDFKHVLEYFDMISSRRYEI